jgi:hypothetical protein
MFKKLLSLGIAVLLTGAITSVPALAQSQVERETAQAAKIKAKVTRIGTGRRATVSVKLKDNSKLKGYIGQIAEEHFTLVDPKHGTVTPVPYEQVQQIKNTNHSAVFALGAAAGIIGGVMLLVVISLRGS